MIPDYVRINRDVLEEKSRNLLLENTTPWGNTYRVLGKYIFFLDENDNSITPDLKRDGFWEAWVTVAMARNLREGMVCVDIGANQGYYTILMADAVGDSGQVIACEPLLPYRDLIDRTAKANGMANRITILSQAISNVIGELVELRIPENNFGSTSMDFLHFSWNEVKSTQKFHTYTNTLDNIFRVSKKIDFIKIDAEGSEQLIWKGSKKAFQENEEVAIFMEWKLDRYEDPEKFLDEIRSEGFHLGYVDFQGDIKLCNPKYFLHNDDYVTMALRRNPALWISSKMTMDIHT